MSTAEQMGRWACLIHFSSALSDATHADDCIVNKLCQCVYVDVLSYYSFFSPSILS